MPYGKFLLKQINKHIPSPAQPNPNLFLNMSLTIRSKIRIETVSVIHSKISFTR